MRIVSNKSGPGHTGWEVGGIPTCWWCADCHKGFPAPHADCGGRGSSHYITEEAAIRQCRCKDKTTHKEANVPATKKKAATTVHRSNQFRIIGDELGYPKVENPPIIDGTPQPGLFFVNYSQDRDADGTYNPAGAFHTVEKSAHNDSYSGSIVGIYDPETKLITVTVPEEGFIVAEKAAFKPLPKPVTRFSDTPENRKADKAEVTALRKALEATKDMTKQEFIDAVTPLKAEAQVLSISVLTGTSLDEAKEAAIEQVTQAYSTTAALAQAFKGVDFETRTRTLRHLAHLYNIGKGLTWLR
jgi:hypothetical protein